MPFKMTGNAAQGVRRGIGTVSAPGALAQFDPLLDTLASRSREAMKQRIETSTMVDGSIMPALKNARPKVLGPWESHAGGSLVVRLKTDHPYQHQPLLNTTAMYQSIHSVILREGGKMWGRAAAGPGVFYARFQNNGTKTIPKRTFIGISTADTRKDERDVHSFAERALNGAAHE
jgi:hypothetical protein